MARQTDIFDKRTTPATPPPLAPLPPSASLPSDPELRENEHSKHNLHRTVSAESFPFSAAVSFPSSRESVASILLDRVGGSSSSGHVAG